MKDDAAERSGKIEEIGRANQKRTVSEELARLIEPLQAEFAHAVSISFEFQKALHLHIDLRTLREAHSPKPDCLHCAAAYSARHS